MCDAVMKGYEIFVVMLWDFNLFILMDILHVLSTFNRCIYLQYTKILDLFDCSFVKMRFYLIFYHY